MAAELSRSWQCKLCSAIYCTLQQTVGHIRSSHAHEPGLHINCGIDCCPQTFRKAETYYKHVRNAHFSKYNKDSLITRERDHAYGLDSATLTSTEEDETEHVNLTDLDSSQDVEQDGAASRTQDVDVEEETNNCNHQCTSHHSPERIASDYLLTLRQKPGVTLSMLNEIVAMSQSVVSAVVGDLCVDVHQVLREEGIQLESPLGKKLDSLFKRPTHWLEGLETSYKQNSFFHATYAVVDPLRMHLGTHIGFSKGGRTLENIPDEFVYIPLLESVKQLLSNESVLQQVMSGPHQLLQPAYGDVCDGEVFTANPVFQNNSTALQIIAYFDEAETANPIGSKASTQNKLGCVYYTLGNIDPAHRSSLDCILLVAMFNCNLLKVYSIDDILQPFYNDIDKLSQGITFTMNGKEIAITGTLLAFCGDTPASNKVGGFKEGVGGSFRKCRLCMATDEEIQSQFVEEEFTLRNATMHEQQCEQLEDTRISPDEKAHYSRVYGINRASALTNLHHFDVTKQLPLDVMHILLEGVVPLHLGLFRKYATEGGLVQLHTLNAKIAGHRFEYFESDKRPSPIAAASVSAGDLTGKQSASQSWCLLHILPLMIGNDLQDDNHYHCVMLLQDICSIVFSPYIPHDQTLLLHLLIAEYLCTFKSLYTRPLTPKMHFLVHLPSQIIRFGPPTRVWCMRYEARHKTFKQWARLASYKNLCWSLSKRFQEGLAQKLSSKSFLLNSAHIGTSTQILVGDLPERYAREIISTFGADIGSLYKCTQISIYGTDYKKGCWLLTGRKQVVNSPICYPVFSRVEVLISISHNSKKLTPYLIVTNGVNTKYMEHLRAYFVNASEEISVIHPSDIIHYKPMTTIQYADGYIVKPRIDLCSLLQDLQEDMTL